MKVIIDVSLSKLITILWQVIIIGLILLMW